MTNDGWIPGGTKCLKAARVVGVTVSEQNKSWTLPTSSSGDCRHNLIRFGRRPTVHQDKAVARADQP